MTPSLQQVTKPNRTMAEVILLQGPSGSGKTTAARNLPPGESLMLTPNSKLLPWPGAEKQWEKRKLRVNTLDELSDMADKLAIGLSKNPEYVKYILIEDGTHYLTERMMSVKFQAMNTGNGAFERYKKLAFDVMKVREKFEKLPSSVTVVWIHHVEEEQGKYVFKIQGKLLRNEMDFVSYFRIVWHSVVTDAPKREDKYKILTNDDGIREAKSPMGMFAQDLMPNDLLPMIQRVIEYNKG